MKNHKNLGMLLLLVAVFAWIAVVRPQIGSFSAKALEAKVKSEEVKSYDQRISDLKAIKAQGAAVEQVVQSLYLAMPKRSQIPEVLVMVENLGNSTGVVFTSASVGAATAGEVPVSISFQGDLTAVNKFLDAIYSNVRTAVVKNQSMTADATGNMTINMQLGLLYQGEE